MRPAPPGQRVASGHLRVDADKAIAKLREYQLADRTEWVLEAIRGAVCLGATSISVRGDANDVWLDWVGASIPNEHLADLLDELVSPGSAKNRGRRLIASGLNSALGMKPSFVDVTSIGERGAWSARYLPSVLDGGDSNRVAAVSKVIDRPLDFASAGGRIHFRRPLRTEVLHYLFVGPPEIRLAKDRCRELQIPITVNGVPLKPQRSPIRVPIELGLSAFIELADPAPSQTAAAVLIELAELGVVLQRYSLTFRQLKSTTPLPIRLFVNANRLHTNASRSEVRRDVYPVATLEKEVERYVASLLEALRAALGDGLGTIDEHDPNRRFALELIASRTRHKSLAEAVKSSQLKDSGLLDVPLVFDACGRPRPVAHDWGFDIHRGRRPYPAELAPWLDDVLWIKDDDPSALLFGNAQPSGRTGRKRAKRARAQLAAHKRFAAGPKRELVLGRLGLELVRSPIGAHVEHSCVAAILMVAKRDRLRGELALTSGPTALELCYLERSIASATPPPAIPVAAVIDSPALQPLDDYQGLQRGDALTQVMDVVQAQAVASVEALVNREFDLGATTGFTFFVERIGKSEFAELVRRALVVSGSLSLLAQRGQQTPERRPLHLAPVWLLTTGESVSLAELRSYLVIGTTRSELTGPHPFGERLIVIASPSQQDYLVRALEPMTRVILYNSAHFRAGNLVDRAIDAAGASRDDVFTIKCENENVRGVVVCGPGLSSTLVLAHGGQPFRRRERKSQVPHSFIWAEVADAIPDWEAPNRSTIGSARNFSFKAWERLAIAEMGRRVVSTEQEIDSKLGRLFFEALGSLRNLEKTLGPQLYEALRSARLFRSIDGSRVSAIELERAFSKSIFILQQFPTQVVPDWTPAVCNPLEITALKALSARPVRDGNTQHNKRASRYRADLVEAERANWLASILESPAYDELFDGPTVDCGTKRMGAKVGLGDALESIRAHITIEGRLFKTITLPSSYGLEAIVHIDSAMVPAPFTELTEETRKRMSVLCQFAIGPLLCKLAKTSPGQFVRSGAVRELAARWLSDGTTVSVGRVVSVLQEEPIFESLRGGAVSVAGARPTQVCVARFYDAWLEPEQKDDDLDMLSRQIIRYHEDDPAFATIFKALAPDAIDLTDRVRTLQLQRRVERGPLGVPSINRPLQLTRKLHELDRSIGVVGEIGLADESATTVQLFSRGKLLSSHSLNLPIPVVAHVEVGAGATDPWQGERLGATLGEMTGPLLDEIVDEQGIDSIPANVRRALKKLILRGEFPSNKSEAWELFLTTRGGYVTASDLIDQQSMHGDIWYVTKRTNLHPLKRSRFALVLPASEVVVGGSDFTLVDAEALLAEDAVARARLARPRVHTLALSPAQQESALVVRQQKTNKYNGIVAPLRPDSAALRGLSLYHDGIYIGDFDDPCEWPTASVVESEWLNVNRTLDAPIDDARWKELKRTVRACADTTRALEPSRELLSSLSILKRHKFGETSAWFRGLLWLECDPAFSGVHVQVGGRRVLYSPSISVHGVSVPLPIVGELVAYPQLDEMPTAFLATATERTHSALILKFLEEAWKDEGKLDESRRAHLAYALAVGAVAPGRCKGIPFPELDITDPANALANWFKTGNRQLADTFLGEDSLTTRTLTMLLDRAEATEQELVAPILSAPISRNPEASIASGLLPAVVAPAERARGALEQALQDVLSQRPYGRAVVDIEFSSSSKAPVVEVNGSVVRIGYLGEIERLAESLVHNRKRPHWLVEQLALHALTLLRKANVITASEEMTALAQVAEKFSESPEEP